MYYNNHLTVFAQPVKAATGYMMQEQNGEWLWKICGIGLGYGGADTGWQPCPFKVPHSDFASWIANGYVNAIANEVGGEAGIDAMLRICFNWRNPAK